MYYVDRTSTNVAREARGGERGGYALVTALMFFLAASTAVMAGISDSVVREVKVVRNESASKQSYFTAESALEDVVYRVKTARSVDASESLSIGSSVAAVTTVTTPEGNKAVTSTADSTGTERAAAAMISSGTGTSFPYALQTGLGGIELAGGSSVQGDIYTTGSIRGCSGCSVTGMAVAAATSSTALDQDNSSPTVPAQSVTFGSASASQDVAQSFTVSTSGSLMKVSVYIRKVGNPSNATVKVTAHSNAGGGRPNWSNPLASGTVSAPLASSSYQWMDITLTANPNLTAGTTYWIGIDGNTDPTNHYQIAANSTYGSGQARVGRGDTNSWNNTSPSGLDLYFRAYTGTNNVGVTGIDEYNRLAVGSAYASQVSFVNATGAIYCQTGGSNNKACDTSRAEPTVLEMPISATGIDTWKAQAEAGGTQTGNVTVDWAGLTLGPRKIVGDLTVSGGGTLRVSGALWVTGNVVINGGAHVTSADGSKSFPIVADGTVSLTGGADITGGAQSHILIASTNAGSAAISINGGANDTALYAPNGTIVVSGGATVNAAVAKRIYADGGSQIIYNPGLSNLNLSTGGADGTYSVRSWKEVE